MNPLFAPILQPLLAHAGIKSILLAGADGDLATWLLDTGGPAGPLLHVASPSFSFDIAAMRARGGDRLVLHPSRAADALSLMPLPDLLIIDGEPNWYAVSLTLQAAARQAATLSAPFPLTLVSDTAWPYARRDRYTDPGTMPAEFTRPHERAGVLPGQSGLAAGAGLFADRFHAKTENEPKNGVLTAIEEFLIEQDGLGIASLPLLHGISLIYQKTIPLPDLTRSALDSIHLGAAARETAAATETARLELMVEAAQLRRALAAAEYGFDAARTALDRERKAVTPPPDLRSIAADRVRRAVRRAKSLGRTALAGIPKAAEANSGQPTDDDAKIERLRQSPILDAAWYTTQYGDVAGADADPATHYYLHGAAEGRDPGPAFSTRFYLDTNPDVAVAGHNPVLHYLASGALEGRDPGPHFSSAFYLQSNPDVAEAGLNPLEHYLANGKDENRRPLP
jgi:hypothetical protein